MSMPSNLKICSSDLLKNPINGKMRVYSIPQFKIKKGDILLLNDYFLLKELEYSVKVNPVRFVTDGSSFRINYKKPTKIQLLEGSFIKRHPKFARLNGLYNNYYKIKIFNFDTQEIGILIIKYKKDLYRNYHKV